MTIGNNGGRIQGAEENAQVLDQVRADMRPAALCSVPGRPDTILVFGPDGQVITKAPSPVPPLPPGWSAWDHAAQALELDPQYVDAYWLGSLILIQMSGTAILNPALMSDLPLPNSQFELHSCCH